MERVVARQTGAAGRSSRLLWATVGLSRGAGTHVAGAREKDLHLHGDVGASRSRHPPAPVAPSPSEMFLILCYVQLKTFRDIAPYGGFSFEYTEIAVYCMAGAGGPKQAPGIGLSCF